MSHLNSTLSSGRCQPPGGSGTLLPDGPDEYDPAGDILVGAKAIAAWLYGSTDKKAQRRVFRLAALQRPGMGFFKMGATICLSKSQFRAYVRSGGKPWKK